MSPSNAPPNPTCRRILVIRGGAIGDFILTLPVFAALRRHFPAARLEVLGYPHIAQLAVAGGLADAVRALESREFTPLFTPDAAMPEETRRYLGSFDLVLSYLYDPDRVFEQNLTRMTPGRFIAGCHRPGPGSHRHAADILLDPLLQLGVPTTDSTPCLRLGQRAETRPILAVHPGSGSERKNWPEDRWAALLPRLARRGPWRLLLVGGEAEGDRIERLARCWPADRCELARQLPLVELAHRLAECQFFVGHDSGITHLAAALGLPGLVLWGDSAFEVWRPRSPIMDCILARDGLQALRVGTVLAALDRSLSRLHAPGASGQ